MHIDSSIIGMESARRYSSSTTRYSRFVVKDYSKADTHGMQSTMSNLLNPDSGEGLPEEKQKTAEPDNNEATMDTIENLRQQVESMRTGRVNIRSSVSGTAESFKHLTVRYIFSMLFGQEKANKILGEDYTEGITSTESSMWTSFNTSMKSSNVLTLQSEQYYSEQESTSFSAKGIVKTADGREISINVDVGMSRSFTRYFKEEMEIVPVNTCDPLVLNFDGNPAEVTDQKFFFDIDGDGEKDEISRLSKNSGYLALDKNGDGVINDGTELFGPQSGSGFQDLAAYDEDGNGWIDEADSIWSKLKIWCQNDDGTSTLYRLSDKNVGAICLENAATDFALNNAANRTNGYIRSTGIFLYENGEVGTVQHLDLAK